MKDTKHYTSFVIGLIDDQNITWAPTTILLSLSSTSYSSFQITISDVLDIVHLAVF